MFASSPSAAKSSEKLSWLRMSVTSATFSYRPRVARQSSANFVSSAVGMLSTQ